LIDVREQAFDIPEPSYEVCGDFSPTPRTPGKLSDASPTSATKEGRCEHVVRLESRRIERGRTGHMKQFRKPPEL
jgi:hypothetical protein